MTAIDVSKMWAVVPVAGSGKRLQPHTFTRPKPLLFVAGQPIIGHILDQIRALGVDKLVLVVGHQGGQILDYVGERGDFETVVSVEQGEPIGLAHAVSLAGPSVGTDPLLVVYGDTVFEADLAEVVRRGGDGLLGVRKVEDPRRCGVVVEESGRVTRLVEKPEEFVSDLAICGVNMIADSALLFACIDELIAGEFRTRGEFQLTDAFQIMVDKGARFGTFTLHSWFDCGTHESLLDTNRHLLSRRNFSGVAGDVVIRPPVYVDPCAEIDGSVIGPYVSVGKDAVIRNAVVRNSIVGAGAQVEGIVLDESIVGYCAMVNGRPSHLNVGDNSQITS